MVITRAEGGCGDSGKEESPWPTLPRLGEGGLAAVRENHGKPPEADGEEGGVREHVSCIREGAKGRPVGEEVIVLRLLLWGENEDGENERPGSGSEQGEVAGRASARWAMQLRARDSSPFRDATMKSVDT